MGGWVLGQKAAALFIGSLAGGCLKKRGSCISVWAGLPGVTPSPGSRTESLTTPLHLGKGIMGDKVITSLFDVMQPTVRMCCPSLIVMCDLTRHPFLGLEKYCQWRTLQCHSMRCYSIGRCQSYHSRDLSLARSE